MKDAMFAQFSVNIDAASTEWRTMAGQKYLVGPAVIAREGVMNRVFYSAYELQKSLRTWNGRPITVNHPYDADGKPVTANSPTILDAQGVGFMFHTTWGADKKLRTEVWLREDAIKAGKIAGINEKGEITTDSGVMELSTGLFHQFYTVPDGVFEDTAYNIEAYDLLGDHLALLPDKRGSFAVQMGAGFPRWNEDSGDDPFSALKNYAREQKGEIIFVHEKFFVYKVDDILYRLPCQKTNGVFTRLEGDPQPVTVDYKLTQNTNSNERPDMSDPVKPTTEQPAPEAKTPTKAEVIAAFNAAITDDVELIGTLAGRLPWLKDAKTLYDANRKSMETAIAANAENTFTSEELSAMPFTMVEKLHKLAQPKAAPAAKPDEGAGDFSVNSDTPATTTVTKSDATATPLPPAPPLFG